MHYWPGKLAACPNALSCREQDIPQGAEDDQLKACELYLILLQAIVKQVYRAYKVISS
jgi:hypothetical protein